MELMELSALVDEYDSLRNERLAADKVAALLKKRESAVAERLIEEMCAQDTFFCASKSRRVKMTPISKPKAVDWGIIYAYMKENDAMDLVQRRLHETAINDRIEEGEEIPGIQFIQVNKLSIGNI